MGTAGGSDWTQAPAESSSLGRPSKIRLAAHSLAKLVLPLAHAGAQLGFALGWFFLVKEGWIEDPRVVLCGALATSLALSWLVVTRAEEALDQVCPLPAIDDPELQAIAEQLALRLNRPPRPLVRSRGGSNRPVWLPFPTSTAIEVPWPFIEKLGPNQQRLMLAWVLASERRWWKRMLTRLGAALITLVHVGLFWSAVNVLAHGKPVSLELGLALVGGFVLQAHSPKPKLLDRSPAVIEAAETAAGGPLRAAELPASPAKLPSYRNEVSL